jgi:hypothetical protein
MLQIKTFPCDPQNIDDQVNAFLRTLKSEAVKSIDVRETGFAVIQYEIKDAWSDRICSECKYWDDGGSVDAVSGLCQECGGRRRFNCRACDRFKDVRG